MATLSSEFLYNIELCCNVTDVTACLFVMLILIVAAVQKWNRNIHHFLTGLILLLNGICCQVLVRAFEFAHKSDGGPAMIADSEKMMEPGRGPAPSSGGTLQHLISMVTAPGNADTLIRIISFIFIFFSIGHFFSQAVSAREPVVKRRTGGHRVIAIKLAVIIVSIVIYLITDRDEVLTVVTMLCLVVGLCFTVKHENFAFRRAPMIISVMLPVFACALTLAVSSVQFAGIALAIMYVILYIEFHTYVETQLSARESELAESRIRLMNEQITSHFAFNSLKVIEDMCRTDPEKAGQTINVFSKYLRSDLENITAAGMIPFEDELEHTKQYIQLEQLEGSASFNVIYDIGTADFEVPPFVLEPLAENAIKHGVKVCGADTITISTHTEDGSIQIRVSDNGNTDARTKAVYRSGRRSVALDNIRSRLRMQCGGTLDIDYTERGTVATIRIPWANVGT